LNLIEHNRRRIGGKLLSDIARALGVEPARLVDGADADLLDQMRRAAGQLAEELQTEVEVARAEEMAARYPGWGGLVAAQADRIAALQQQVQTLADRMSYDPELAGSLHDVISAVSAIRSAASILIGPEKLDEDWQRRFHENIHNDSLRLAARSEALIAYLETPEADLDQSAPLEQVDRYLAQSGFHIAALEDPESDPVGFVTQSGLPKDAQTVLRRHALQYQADAQKLPLAAFSAACRDHHYDPAALAGQFQAPFSTILRRLASLPKGAGHPPFGFASCDAAGILTVLKPVPGFSMPRVGGACPLWPLYAAMARPAQPVRLSVTMPGSVTTRLLCYAVADSGTALRFDMPPPVTSTMLVVPDPPQTETAPLPVGVSCRICPRAACHSRREPAMAGLSEEATL
jgi:predicted transcriptional regulator